MFLPPKNSALNGPIKSFWNISLSILCKTCNEFSHPLNVRIYSIAYSYNDEKRKAKQNHQLGYIRKREPDLLRNLDHINISIFLLVPWFPDLNPFDNLMPSMDFNNKYLTNRFHVAVRLFSNRSQMTSKCGKHKKVAKSGSMLTLNWIVFNTRENEV